MESAKPTVRLTEYSHGAGCGCKISPAVLTEILASNSEAPHFPNLLIGNDTRDDAAVYAIDNERSIISTTDFFMPIVDDPGDFGGIASVNAISDVYAMGGTPMMAIAILGWPINKLDPSVANEVIEGARQACQRAGIPLAGGHSIDAPEPIFGLAVTGSVLQKSIKANSAATVGCELFLTKPLGVGILSTAQKKGKLREEDRLVIRDLMLTLNDFGVVAGTIDSVRAMTDVTGFGLLGHLVELCEGANLTAHIQYDKVPTLPMLDYYLEEKTFPGGTARNFASYGHHIAELTDEQRTVLCDPQTSGGLLLAVEPSGREALLAAAEAHGLTLEAFGTLVEPASKRVVVR